MTELIENDRIIGGLSSASVEAASVLYSLFHRGRLLRTDARTAEMVKLVENAYRDLNIAFANEIARLCGRFGLNVWEVRNLANRHPRVDLLKPGPGVGGHCIAVDPWFLVHAAPDLTPLIQAARQVNDSRPLDVVEEVKKLAEPGESIACLGLAYKSDTGDLRESPACTVVAHLHTAGLGPLLVVEPYIEQLPVRLAHLDIRLVDLDQALERAKLVLLLVDHQEFRCLDPGTLEGKRVIDTRGCWPSTSVEVAPG